MVRERLPIYPNGGWKKSRTEEEATASTTIVISQDSCFMVAGRNMLVIRFAKCVDTFRSNNWSVDDGHFGEKEKDRMRHKWDRWHLNKINVLRGGSEMAYNQRNRDLVTNLNIKVETISDVSVDWIRINNK